MVKFPALQPQLGWPVLSLHPVLNGLMGRWSTAPHPLPPHLTGFAFHKGSVWLRSSRGDCPATRLKKGLAGTCLLPAAPPAGARSQAAFTPFSNCPDSAHTYRKCAGSRSLAQKGAQRGWGDGLSQRRPWTLDPLCIVSCKTFSVSGERSLSAWGVCSAAVAT